MTFAVEPVDDGFRLRLNGLEILHHSADAPCLFVGSGDPRVAMHRGHVDIADYVVERIALRHAEVAGDRVRLAAHPGAPWMLALSLSETDGHAVIAVEALADGLNRFWLRTTAEPGEHIWGGGEQFSHFDMAGRRFPLWSSEPGVGRDKSTMISWMADNHSGAGGDYWTTNYPQPTWISSRRYALHVDSSAYAVFDFRHDGFHEVEVWEVPGRIELWSRPRFADLVTALSARFGRQPRLPDWLLTGAVIGLKDGAASFERLERYEAAGVPVAGLWCEDWVGLRITSFGSRLFWDWQWNAERYPHLRQKIAELADRGIRFLGYVNPYLAVDGPLYAEAAAGGHLVMRPDADEPYVIDFGEFDCAHVDFTSPAAMDWFAEAIIGRNMIDFGLSGWMADFGEYLPVDARLANGESGMTAHNRWPALWAEANARGVAGRGRTGDALFFMRSGATGSQAHCPMLWAGDQSVDFSRHDGIGTVICAALSSGLLGNAYHHSDIGGYTSLFEMVRTPELLMRWTEMAAFTAMMRSHEGNRPRQNTQLDDTPELLAHLARMTRIHVHLAPLLGRLSAEAEATGLPVQRPLFLHFEEDADCYPIQTAYLFGPDLLVAPVIEAGKAEWPAYLPAGADWVHVWTGETHPGGREVTLPAPIGRPPLFYRAGCADAALFAGIAAL